MSESPTGGSSIFQRYLLPGFAFKAVVIGGGYATGRELAEFFLPSGAWGGLAAMALSMTEPSLKPLMGKTVAEIAKMRGVSPEQAVIDLVLADKGRSGAIYFLMKEDNVRRQAALPWVSFGSDAEASAPEGVFLKSSTHPRAYGNFARFLGKYVRDEKVAPLADAVRRLSALPAQNLGLSGRGMHFKDAGQ